MLCCRGWVPGRGEAGTGPLPRLQQAHPTRAEHDSEGRGRLRTGFHPADQCGNYSHWNFYYKNRQITNFWKLFQNEKNQIMKSNVWLRLVRSVYCTVRTVLALCCAVCWTPPGVERLPAAVGRGGLRRHQRPPPPARQSLETRHCPLQQVSNCLKKFCPASAQLSTQQLVSNCERRLGGTWHRAI